MFASALGIGYGAVSEVVVLSIVVSFGSSGADNGGVGRGGRWWWRNNAGEDEASGDGAGSNGSSGGRGDTEVVRQSVAADGDNLGFEWNGMGSNYD